MLGELFDYVLTTYAQSESKEQFQARMSSFRCPLGVASSVKEPPKFTSPRDKAYESVATLWRGRGLSGQTTAAFMEKLGTSPIGKDLVSKVEDAAGTKMGNAEDEMKKAVDRTLQDVAQKFEAFGEEASAFFQRRARILSIIVAIIVAFVLHVDAIDLFSTLLRDPNSRAAVLATQDNALKWAKRAEAEIAKLESSTPASADIKTAAEDLRKAEQIFATWVYRSHGRTSASNKPDFGPGSREIRARRQARSRRLSNTTNNVRMARPRLCDFRWGFRPMLCCTLASYWAAS